MQTTFSQLLGIRHPIMQAPIGGAAGSELAASVSNAGALRIGSHAAVRGNQRPYFTKSHRCRTLRRS